MEGDGLVEAAEALCLLAESGSVSGGMEREERKNLEAVRLYLKKTLKPVRGASKRKRAPTVVGSDIGRRVEVLWIPYGFPRYKRVERADLRPYKGYVVRHDASRGRKTHRILYDDRTISWHAPDEIKFLS